jgi:hypothetical protein
VSGDSLIAQAHDAEAVSDITTSPAAEPAVTKKAKA